jgi:hypothetical protein
MVELQVLPGGECAQDPAWRECGRRLSEALECLSLFADLLPEVQEALLAAQAAWRMGERRRRLRPVR